MKIVIFANNSEQLRRSQKPENDDAENVASNYAPRAVHSLLENDLQRQVFPNEGQEERSGQNSGGEAK